MTYTILSAKTDGDTLYTVVEYDLDGEKLQITIPHFQPQTKEDVETGILNRFASEKRKLEACETCETIITELELGKVTQID